MADWETVKNWTKDRARNHQLKQLTDFLNNKVQPHSPFYNRKFRETGFKPGDVNSLDDYREFPFTSKQDLLPTEEKPEKHREFVLQPDVEELKKNWGVKLKALFKGREAVRKEFEQEYRPIFLTATTGRSSSPVAFLYSRYDMDNLRQAGDRLIRVLGGDSSKQGASLFPYAPHLAFWQVVFASLEYGILTLSTGGGKLRGTEGNLDLLQRMQPAYLMGIPSYVYHIVREAVKNDIDLSSLEKFILGGEAISPGGRKQLIQLAEEGGAQDPNVLPTYAFTEARMAWGECPAPAEDPSGYHFYPDMNLFELRDPETGEIVPDEQGGELVYTPLDARGSVVLRYRTGDICQSIDWGECPHCGRKLPRIQGPIERVSKIEGLELQKVKGTLINFNDLQRMLDEHPMIEEWQVEFRKENDDPMGLDEFHLHINPKSEFDREKVKKELDEDIRQNTEVTPNEYHFHTYEEILERLGLETELKEERFLDNRPGESEE